MRSRKDIERSFRQADLDIEINAATDHRRLDELAEIHRQSASSQTVWQTAWSSRAFRLAAVITLVGTVALLIPRRQTSESGPVPTGRRTVSNLELATAVSLEKAFKQGGLKAVEDLYREAFGAPSGDTKPPSVDELLTELETETQELQGKEPMRTKQNQGITLLLVVTLAACAAPAAAYPPDNAAVLYYKAFMLYEEDHEIKSMRDDYWHGQIELNETLDAYLMRNRAVIDTVLDATRIDRCDWGMDYSRGTEVLLPPHHQAREIFFLIAAEATMHFDKGHPRTALEHCVAMYRMARHLNERPLICYIVGIAIEAGTHRCITRFLSSMPPDVETLTWLQSELTHLDKQPFSIGPVLEWKREAATISMSPDRIVDAVHVGLDEGDFKRQILERLRAADAPFYTRNIAYWNDFMDRVEAAFEKPYPQAYAELQKLDKKPCAEFDTNQDATLTPCFAPEFTRIHAISTRLKAHSAAMRAAVELYLSYTMKGRLPETLPAALPVDPFSSEPFQYEKTAEGFILRCTGKALDKNEPYTFEFGIKK